MKEIKLSDRIIYRAGRGKKVKFVDDESKYTEIVVRPENKRKIEEVDD